MAGILAAAVAPAVVRYANLMPVVARPSGVVTFPDIDGFVFQHPTLYVSLYTVGHAAPADLLQGEEGYARRVITRNPKGWSVQ